MTVGSIIVPKLELSYIYGTINREHNFIGIVTSVDDPYLEIECIYSTITSKRGLIYRMPMNQFLEVERYESR